MTNRFARVEQSTEGHSQVEREREKRETAQQRIVNIQFVSKNSFKLN